MAFIGIKNRKRLIAFTVGLLLPAAAAAWAQWQNYAAGGPIRSAWWNAVIAQMQAMDGLLAAKTGIDFAVGGVTNTFTCTPTTGTFASAQGPVRPNPRAAIFNFARVGSDNRLADIYTVSGIRVATVFNNDGNTCDGGNDCTVEHTGQFLTVPVDAAGQFLCRSHGGNIVVELTLVAYVY